MAPAEMFEVVGEYVFPFLEKRAEKSFHGKHMKDARLTILTAALLQKAVDGLDVILMQDRDTKGDVCTSTCSRRLPPRAKTGNSTRHGTSSGSHG